MVTPVAGSTPYSYYNLLNPDATPLSFGGSSNPYVSTPSGGYGYGTTTVPGFSLLSQPQISPQLLSLLQSFGPGSSSTGQIASLLGGGSLYGASSNYAAQSILGQSYTSALALAYQYASQTPNSPQFSPVSAILNNYLAGINAGNPFLPGTSVDA